jgi:hypothetical protein
LFKHSYILNNNIYMHNNNKQLNVGLKRGGAKRSKSVPCESVCVYKTDYELDCKDFENRMINNYMHLTLDCYDPEKKKVI